MDYENKHREEITRATQLWKCGDITRENLEYIFPELKESEDERIRKEIISHLQHEYVVKRYVSDVEYDRWIAWLEKQGEQPKEATYTHEVETGNGNIKALVTEKVQLPKFKVGDWIVNNQTSTIYLVKSIRDNEYCLWLLDAKIESFLRIVDVDSEYHLWTIQDAKDGDVVVDKSDGTIGIFQSIGHKPDGGSYNDPSYCFLHCRYDDGFFYADFENGNTMDSDDVIPATKKQRDLLFQKMKDAGYECYEWDDEKKELRNSNEGNN